MLAVRLRDRTARKTVERFSDANLTAKTLAADEFDANDGFESNTVHLSFKRY